MNRDQFLCEMMGKCWHEFVPVENDWPECRKCRARKFHVPPNPNFSSTEHAYRLMQYAMGADWWDKFYWDTYERHNIIPIREFVAWLFSDPDRFAGLVAEYRGWRNE